MQPLFFDPFSSSTRTLLFLLFSSLFPLSFFFHHPEFSLLEFPLLVYFFPPPCFYPSLSRTLNIRIVLLHMFLFRLSFQLLYMHRPFEMFDFLYGGVWRCLLLFWDTGWEIVWRDLLPRFTCTIEITLLGNIVLQL